MMIDPLARYWDILEGRSRASYLSLRSHGVEFSSDCTTDELWNIHAKEMDRFRREEHTGDHTTSLLDLKEEIAQRILISCQLCERRCQADRTAGKRGHCGVLEPRISSEFIHLGEEPPLVPSYTIFFAGCTFDCVFCQNYDISTDPASGISFEPEVLADLIERRFETITLGRYSMMEKARNVNWVGGDPTPNLPYILTVLKQCNANIPQVWNSNMYLTPESMAILDGVIDLYLTDFKYGNDECAERLSNASRYWEVATRNHLEASRQAEVIVRHLVLPNHVECCSFPVLEWLADKIPGVMVNVMAQYRPVYRAKEHRDISRHLGNEEYQAALGKAKDLDLILVI
ncbi:MAG TPA: radical SAM protein [Methanomassiliicoccales archaeon]|nr:radical SAM protein [Methanomassiliicoccales archaeon]